MKTKPTGFPDEVTPYHPIEFLELNKMVFGFLNTQLEKYKGGAKNQLLVGHVMKLVSEKGIKVFETLPYFRMYYMGEILDKFKKKGIDLKDAKQVPLDLEKLNILSDDYRTYQTKDAFVKSSNIYASSNYAMFHFLPFNRTVSRTHVNALVESIKENGVISYPIMIKTDCIDGAMRYWLVDGQHRFCAFKKLGLPVHFTLYQKQGSEPVTKKDIVKLVARVNNTSRRWNIHQYLRAWASLEVQDYLVIKKSYDETKIAINTLLQAYSGQSRTLATRSFMSGAYAMTDSENGKRYVAWLASLRGLLPKSTNLQVALLDLFRKYPDYDSERMRAKIAKVRSVYDFGDTQEEMLQRLESLYKEAIEVAA